MKRKYNYELMMPEIEALSNEGVSLRGIARRLGVCSVSLHIWMKKNVVKVIKYIPKKKGSRVLYVDKDKIKL